MRQQVEQVALRLLGSWYGFYSGGPEWGAWCSYLSFVRDFVGWRDDSHASYAFYESAAIHGGPRFMHEKFCLVSLKAKTRLVNDSRQLHCESGPSLEFHCGYRQWNIDGVEVDEQVVLRPETQTLAQIIGEPNEEVRRVRIDRFGWVRFLALSEATVVDARHNDRDNQEEKLFRMSDGRQRFVCVDPSTGRRYALGVPRDLTTCEESQNWMSSGLDKFAIHRS
jgi:hypothetical protein